MIHLLDTDTLIDLVRGIRLMEPARPRDRERQQLARRLLAHCQKMQGGGDEVGLSAITLAELEFGARSSEDYEREIAAVRKMSSPFVLYDFDAAACAAHYGEIRFALESAGSPIGAMDLLIAAHALALGATLVTNNLAHFSRVPGLHCVRWG